MISTKAFYDSISTDGPQFYSITLGDDYENNDYMFVPELRNLESAFGMAGKKLNHTNVLYSNISQDKYGIQARCHSLSSVRMTYLPICCLKLTRLRTVTIRLK